MLDSNLLVAALEGAHPSGPNLEYDPDFLALDRAQQGRPEQMIGDAVIKGEPPDWRDVQARAEALLERTRDLRVAVALTNASFRTQGFSGLRYGLTIIEGLLTSQWSTVHPQLDAEDNDDPSSRMNSLLLLAAPEGLLKPIREMPVIYSKTLGRFCLRDVRIALGKHSAPAGMAEPPKPEQINAALRDADPEAILATTAEVTRAFERVVAIDTYLTDKVGAQAPDLKPLMVDLSEIRHALAPGGTAEKKAGAAQTAHAGDTSSAAPDPGLGSTSAAISSREDVVRQIDKLCEYYQRHEPSSPVPLLLRRAKRLVSKDFLEIIRDLTPSGVAEAELIGGVEKSSN